MDPYRSDARTQERIVLLERLRIATKQFVHVLNVDPGFPFKRYVELTQLLDELDRNEREC